MNLLQNLLKKTIINFLSSSAVTATLIAQKFEQVLETNLNY